MIAVLVVVPVLAGCQPSGGGALGSPCALKQSDGGPMLYGDVAPVTGVMDWAATECSSGLCYRDRDAVRGLEDAGVTGACSTGCTSDVTCITSPIGLRGKCVLLPPGPGESYQDMSYCVYSPLPVP